MFIQFSDDVISTSCLRVQAAWLFTSALVRFSPLSPSSLPGVKRPAVFDLFSFHFQLASVMRSDQWIIKAGELQINNGCA